MHHPASSPLHRPGHPRRIAGEPRWRLQGQLTAGELPADCRRWLTDDGSLTARLIGLRQGPFAVRRLFQGWATPLESERALLRLRPKQLTLVREVVLSLGGQPVVFARTVLPIASLRGSLGHLRHLQNRSLGAFLFSQPGMRRSPFEVALIAGDSDYLAPEVRQAPPAWGRRSCFDIRGRRLLVSEVFLEAFTPWPALLAVHRSQRGRVDAAILRPKQ